MLSRVGDLNYAVSKLGAAVDALEGPGYIQAKLFDACMVGLARIFPDDFPDPLRGEYEQILQAISWIPPQEGLDEGKVEATINAMSKEEARSLKKRISDLYVRANEILYENRFDKLKQRAAAGNFIEIPLEAGGVARFPESALMEAFANAAARFRGGANAVEEHPLCAAARSSSDPYWRNSFYAAGALTSDRESRDVPDLSE